MEILTKTQSLCPSCLKIIDADVYEENGKVYIRKTCKKHGTFKDIYWESAELYKKARKYAFDGREQENPNVKKAKKDVVCPKDCGLCAMHKSHTALANLVVTNRCDLSCWYCFFFAEKAGYVHEPGIGLIRKMVHKLREEMPIPCNAIQITGGEPTMRKDLIEIIAAIKEEGIEHVQLNTNGITLSKKPEIAKNLRNAGVNTLYMSFDGVTAKTNPKNHWEAPKAIENCRKVGMGIVLVPTVIRSVNEHELGDIIKFGFENIDVIRGVNFQPVSLVGKMPRSDIEKFRITIPGAIQKIEEQTNGEISKDDFYPVPSVMRVSKFAEAMLGRPQYDLSTHFACGMATYVFKDKNKMLPITRFIDVPAFFEYLSEKTEELEKGSNKYVVGLKMVAKLNSFIDKKKCPPELKFGKILQDVFLKHDYSALSKFHKKSQFIGMMHFMDLYNYDIERVKRCCIHYVTPEPSMPIVPFCAFNVIPEWYRDKIQKDYSIPVKEWEKIAGRPLSDDYYRRDVKGFKSN